MRKIFLAATALAAFCGGASAQTTVIERDRPADVVVDRPATESKSVTVRDHGDGCTTKTVRKENDRGDTETVKKETCD